MAQITVSDLTIYGGVATAILAMIALGKQLWVVFVWVVKILWQIVWRLVLTPLGYILMWIIEGVASVIDFIKRKLDKASQHTEATS